MLLRDHPCCKSSGRVTLQNRHHCLRQNRPEIKLSRHLVHRRACLHAACVNRPLVCVQTGERGQQLRVNIDQMA